MQINCICLVQRDLENPHKRFIEIPLKPHVRDFVLAEYGEDGSIYARQNQFLGSMILTAIERIPYGRRKVRKRVESTHIRVYLPYRLKTSYIDELALYNLSKFLEKLMFEKMAGFVSHSNMIGNSELNAVSLFLKKYNIDEGHWDLDAAYSCWKRKKQEITKKHIALSS